MIITIEKEITIRTGRLEQGHMLRVTAEIIGGRCWIRNGDMQRRRIFGDKWLPADDLWAMLSADQRTEFQQEIEAEYGTYGLVMRKVSG